MLAFGWRDAQLVDGETLGACDFDQPADVAARLLDFVMTRLFQRGLDLAYRPLDEVGTRPRGSLDIGRTVRELLPIRGALAYTPDELVDDTPANRLLKATLMMLVSCDGVDTPVRQRLARHVNRLGGVSNIPLREARHLSPRVPRHERTYREAIWLAQLALATLFPDEGAPGQGHLRAAREQLPLLFQGFVRGAATYFLGSEAHVHAPQLLWDVTGASPRARSLIPTMNTDVVVDWRVGERVILECKFYETPLADKAHSDGGERFRIGHLYQVLSYANVMRRGGVAPAVALVYASPSGSFDEEFVLDGVPLRVVWVDLQAEWRDLKAQTLDVVRWRGLRTPAQTSSTA